MVKKYLNILFKLFKCCWNLYKKQWSLECGYSVLICLSILLLLSSFFKNMSHCFLKSASHVYILLMFTLSRTETIMMTTFKGLLMLCYLTANWNKGNILKLLKFKSNDLWKTFFFTKWGIPDGKCCVWAFQMYIKQNKISLYIKVYLLLFYVEHQHKKLLSRCPRTHFVV